MKKLVFLISYSNFRKVNFESVDYVVLESIIEKNE